MSYVEIFNKKIPLKTHYCHLFGEEAPEIEEPYINLYIRTKFCNAKCEFCTYASDAQKYDSNKLREVLKEITSKIKIRKYAISGGEPTLYWENFVDIVNLHQEYTPKSELSLNTDGFRWEKLFNSGINKLFDYIQLSRHHYDDSINNEVFKCDTPTSDMIRWASEQQTHPRQIQFRCNLIKKFIDSREEVFNYLKWTNSVGINEVGLVSLMPVNDFSKENFIYFHIKELLGEDFMLTQEYKRYGGGCECFNYVWIPEDNFRRPIKVYHKNTYEPAKSGQDTLVFDGKNLRIGYDGEIIY